MFVVSEGEFWDQFLRLKLLHLNQPGPCSSSCASVGCDSHPVKRLRSLHLHVTPGGQVQHLHLAVPRVFKAEYEVDYTPRRGAAALLQHHDVRFERLGPWSDTVHDLVPVL